MKNKFRNPYEEKKPKKIGRLSQLSKSNRMARNAPIQGATEYEKDWQYQKRFGTVIAQF